MALVRIQLVVQGGNLCVRHKHGAKRSSAGKHVRIASVASKQERDFGAAVARLTRERRPSNEKKQKKLAAPPACRQSSFRLISRRALW